MYGVFTPWVFTELMSAPESWIAPPAAKDQIRLPFAADIAYTWWSLEPTYTTPASTRGDVGAVTGKLQSGAPVEALSAVTLAPVGTIRVCLEASPGEADTPATVADQTLDPVASDRAATLPLAEAAYTRVPASTGDRTSPRPIVADQDSVPA